MALSTDQKNAIENLLRNTVKNKLEKYSRETTSMPFLEKIIQDNEKVAAYSFIHSIATSLGQSIFEQVSVILAEKNSDIAKSGYKIEGEISPNQEQVISDIIDSLKTKKEQANIADEAKQVLQAKNDSAKPINDIVDFYMQKDGKEYLFEIKTAKPNIGTFRETKIKLLKWIAIMNRPVHVYMALPYNPYYPEPYERFTKGGLMDHPNDFLVAGEYWDFIGGDGSFAELLKIFDKVGKDFRKELNSKFKKIAKQKMSNRK